MHILTKPQITELLNDLDVSPSIAEGFIQYTRGSALIPPVAGIEFESPPGDVHIKYGYIKGQKEYVIKVASGFYENPSKGIPSSNGLMLVFCRQTGELKAILLDEGYLTDVRTAVAGALAARQLGPKEINRIGIVGTGTQARLQLSYLKSVTTCRDVLVYGRQLEGCRVFQENMEKEGFHVSVCDSVVELAAQCNLIVTTTPSRSPLLMADHVKPGTHITAVGADTPGKQELDSRIFEKANLVVADSIRQCLERGECATATQSGHLRTDQILEFGKVLEKGLTRSSSTDITVADLTGVAVQDIQIAASVYYSFLNKIGSPNHGRASNQYK